MNSRLQSGALALLAILRNYGFYAIAVVETLILLGVIGQYSTTPQSGSDNGGSDMALFFFILFPFAVLTITVLVYRFMTNSFARVTAAIIVILLLSGTLYLFLRDGLPVAA